MTVIIVSTLCVIFIVLFTIAMIYWVIQIIQLVEFYQKERCGHPHLEERRWVENDGTCMVHHWCNDCGFNDRGHVYADPETWAINNNPDDTK